MLVSDKPKYNQDAIAGKKYIAGTTITTITSSASAGITSNLRNILSLREKTSNRELRSAAIGDMPGSVTTYKAKIDEHIIYNDNSASEPKNRPQTNCSNPVEAIPSPVTVP
jgi:hypothetical protein